MVFGATGIVSDTSISNTAIRTGWINANQVLPHQRTNKQPGKCPAPNNPKRCPNTPKRSNNKRPNPKQPTKARRPKENQTKRQQHEIKGSKELMLLPSALRKVFTGQLLEAIGALPEGPAERQIAPTVAVWRRRCFDRKVITHPIELLGCWDHLFGVIRKIKGHEAPQSFIRARFTYLPKA